MLERIDLSMLPEPHAEWFRRPNGYDASRSIHGISHARRVLVHALELADALEIPEWERQALTYAVLWHDIGRTNDDADYYHGAKSAGKAVALALHEGVEQRVYETALHAITHHCGSEEHAERAACYLVYYELDGSGGWHQRQIDPEAALRVFLLLKDADILDRVRLGDVDTSYLHFEASCERVEGAWALLEEMP